MQKVSFNGKYLGGKFLGIKQDGNKTDTNNNPVMVLIVESEIVKEKLGFETKSTDIEKIRVPQYLIEKGALSDFADYLNLQILLPVSEREWEMKDRDGKMMRGFTISLNKEYKTFLALTDNKPAPSFQKKDF